MVINMIKCSEYECKNEATEFVMDVSDYPEWICFECRTKWDTFLQKVGKNKLDDACKCCNGSGWHGDIKCSSCNGTKLAMK